MCPYSFHVDKKKWAQFYNMYFYGVNSILVKCTNVPETNELIVSKYKTCCVFELPKPHFKVALCSLKASGVSTLLMIFNWGWIYKRVLK